MIKRIKYLLLKMNFESLQTFYKSNEFNFTLWKTIKVKEFSNLVPAVVLN